MGRKKSSQLVDWTGEAHIRIPLRVLNSPAWRVAPFSARAVYVDLRTKMKFITQNGNINAVFSEMKHRGWTSRTTLAKALRQTEVLGLVRKTRQGGIASMSKVCTLYRFTDLPVPEWPKLGIPAQDATHEYNQFSSVKEAAAALREDGDRKKPKVQKMDFVGPETGLMSQIIRPESGLVATSKVQKLDQSKPDETRAAVEVEPK